MLALRPGTFLFWEAARLPFNALLVLFASAEIESLFRYLPAEGAWSYVLTPPLIVSFVLANAFYCLMHLFDRWLQASRLQGKESAGRISLWGGVTLISSAVVSGAANAALGMEAF